MSDNVPIKGKCTWWRETADQEDAFDVRLKDSQKRWTCSCFVEGDYWIYTKAEIPSDCPRIRQCRYYIKHT